jgi:hypothetical protein
VGASKVLDWYGTRDNSSPFTPEKKLALALLVDALRLIQACGDESEEAFGWLTGVQGYHDDWVFSAESICDALGVNVEALRGRLRHMAASDQFSHRMHRAPVVYKDRLYRQKSRRAARAP